MNRQTNAWTCTQVDTCAPTALADYHLIFLGDAISRSSSGVGRNVCAGLAAPTGNACARS
eukprot:4292278-Alexandrium_andersonii.AAC.1